MRKLLDINNPIMRTLITIFDLIALSIFWTVFSLPVVTMGAASAALYHAVYQHVRKGDDYLWSSFWSAFKSNFKRSTKMLLACLLALLFVCAGCGRTAPAANQSITTDGKPVRYLQNDIHFDTKEQTVSEGELFRVQFEGDAVAGTAGVVDGKYRVTATKTDGEAWHIKLESNYPTVPGNDYRITYTFISDAAKETRSSC